MLSVKDPLDCIICELKDDCEALEPVPRWFALIFWAFIAALLAMVFYAYAQPVPFQRKEPPAFASGSESVSTRGQL